jgi:membrane protein DedA with SNARE-associated domain
MALETVVFPIPSEIVMPLAGKEFIADQGRGWYWIIPAGIFGAIGSTIGALGIYYVAKIGGQPFLHRFFNRWGPFAVFFGRMVPLVRSLVSVPAGLVNMPVGQFLVYTFLGSFVWATALAYGGFKLGENYEDLRDWMSPVEYPIAAILGLAVVWYVYVHVKDAWGNDGGTEASDCAKGTS